VSTGFFVGSVLLIYFVFCVVLLCVFTFWVPCCDVRYDFCTKTMFGSSLPPVVCKMAYVFFTLCLFVYSGVQHILFCVFVFFVLSTLCCQFLWIVHFGLPLRYSLTFVYFSYYNWVIPLCVWLFYICKCVYDSFIIFLWLYVSFWALWLDKKNYILFCTQLQTCNCFLLEQRYVYALHLNIWQYQSNIFLWQISFTYYSYFNWSKQNLISDSKISNIDVRKFSNTLYKL
jgi:hypothetical protein